MNQFVETTYERRSDRGGGPAGVGQTAASKVRASLCGLLLGPFLVLSGSALLWQNEKWAIKTHRSLDDARDAHVRIADNRVLESDKDGRLVHVTGPVAVDASPSDEVFGLDRPCAVSLTRHVDIYQWEEKRDTRRTKLSNGNTKVEDVYSYDRKWMAAPNGRGFRHPQGHENYGDVPFGGSQTFRASDVHLGAYTLASVFSRQLKDSTPVSAQQATAVPPGGSIRRDEIYLPFQSPSGNSAAGNTVALRSWDREQGQEQGGDTHVDAIDKQIVTIGDEDTIVYIVKSTEEQFSSRKDAVEALLIEKKIVTLDGEDSITYMVKSTGDQYSTKEKALTAAAKAPPPPPQQKQQPVENYYDPQIGDVRVRFSEVGCYTVSVLGQLQGSILSSWPSPEGAGYDINILTRGQMSAAGMVEQWQTFNRYTTWCKRFGGWLLAFLGFGMLTSIISTAADVSLGWVPFFGPMTVSIINLGVTIANFTLACTTSFLVAGLSWVVYRPFLGSTMLAGSAGIFYFAAESGGRQRGAARSNTVTPSKAKLDPNKEFPRPKAKPY